MLFSGKTHRNRSLIGSQMELSQVLLLYDVARLFGTNLLARNKQEKGILFVDRSKPKGDVAVWNVCLSSRTDACDAEVPMQLDLLFVSMLHETVFEPPHRKTNNLHRRKQRRRSTSR